MHELIHPGQLKGHHAVVVGAGRSGIAAARLLAALGASTRLVERNDEGITQRVRDLALEFGWELRTGAHTRDDFAGVDLVVLSPGVPLSSIKDLIPEKTKVVSELELASWFVSEPMVAVTGTTGKTTTTALIGHILERCGKTVFVGGNIGVPLSEYLLAGKPADILVLEVSSFQLQHTDSFHPMVGVFVNFSPNHLDFHASEEEYFMAKLSLFAKMQERDLAVLHLSLKDELEARVFTGAKRVYYLGTNRFDCPHLRGPHNQENLEAAWLVCRYFNIPEQDVAGSLADFRPKPHRLEIVGEYQGITFVDDSKATTITALEAALKSFDHPIILLAGGIFKGGEPASLNALIRERVKGICLFGASREIFEPAWKDVVPTVWSPTLEQAVENACLQARSGDVVLLSPATSSFDLFKNYKERGQAFSKAVGIYYGKQDQDSSH
ncbi:UDP-N-acetylmuramoyl-L-alanine--D-glutamate ligase [Desulfoplanes sp. PS50]